MWQKLLRIALKAVLPALWELVWAQIQDYLEQKADDPDLKKALLTDVRVTKKYHTEQSGIGKRTLTKHRLVSYLNCSGFNLKSRTVNSLIEAAVAKVDREDQGLV